LATDFVARNIVLDNKINTNNTNVSNYVTITSNILATDFVARDVVLNTAIATNAYTDAKVSTYLGTTATKTIGGILQVGTSSGGGIIKLGGAADDTDFDLATIQNRAYSGGKSEILIFKGNDIEGASGADRIRLRAGAIAFDTFSSTTESSGTTNESIRMYISQNGNVGIGTTNPTTAKLVISGNNADTGLDMATADQYAEMRVIRNSRFSVDKDMYLQYQAGVNSSLRLYSNNVETMTISGGNVGIGTSVVTHKLTILGTGGCQLMITSSTASSSSYMGFANSANDSLAYIGVDGVGLTSYVYGALTLGTWKDKPILFTTGVTNSEKMRIESNGNVGIGITTAINNKLEVNGNINIPLGSTYKINSRDLAFSNLIGIVPPTSLPIAGTGVPGTVGGVKVDGSSITITPAGIISASSASGSKWTLSGTDNIYKVSGNVGIGIDSNLDEKLIVNGNLKITNGSLLTSNIITNILNAQTISGAGSNITRINANNISDGTIDSLRLPLATSSVLGVVKKGSNINIVDGAISVDLLSYNGDSTINGNLVVNSNLIIHGISTTLNTDVYTTERLEVTNGGANSTLTIKQTSAGNTNNILNVINSSAANVFNISSTGAVSTNNNNINAGTGTITAATFSGALSGNATTATNASGLTGNPNISVGAITGSGQTNQITNNTNAGVSFNIKNNSTGNTAFTQIAAQNANGDNFTMFLNSSTRTLDGGANTATLRNDAGDLRLAAALQTPFIYLNKTSVNIGIGTETPANYLHLHKNAASQDIAISLTDTTTGATSTNGLVVRKDSNSIGYLWNYANSPLLLGTNNAERIRIAANGAVGIQNGSATAIINNYMTGGSLTIGNINTNYGGGTGSWNTNTAGLLMECLDNTEFAVHDVNHSIHSFMRYTTNGNFTIGRNMGHGVANVTMPGSLSVTGNVGIDKTAVYKLDVNGDVNATDIRIGGVSLNTTINTNNTNVSNYVSITSNNLINNVRTEFYTKNHIDSSNFIKSSELPTNIITQPILNTCNFIRTDAVTSNFWKNVKSTQNNTIYYGAPVKIGGSNTIDVGNNYILEVLGNVRIKGTITQGWIGDGSTSGDGGVLAPTIFGSGSEITNLNANNITLGTLPVTRGGIGTTALTATQLLVGAGTNPVTSFSGLTWVSGTNTLAATNITGAGSNITNINANNITLGTIDSLRLPTATTSVLGGVKVDGTTITINSSTGVISGANMYVLPTATTSVLGGVRVDGTTITINSGTGVISGANTYVLPTATNSVLGGVKVDGSTITINSSTGVISGANTYVLPTATNSVLGGVKKGNNINIAGDGTISVDLVSYTGNSTINGDLVVNSNLIVHGTSTTLNTDVYTTERLDLTYNGTTNSTLTIRQTAAGNTNNILNVTNSSSTNVFNISNSGNVIIGSATNSSDDGNVGYVFPDSIFYVKAPNVAQGTANITFRGGNAGTDNGKVRIWLASDASHASYIENTHTTGGNTILTFGTSSGNALPSERMRIGNTGDVGIGTNSPTARLHLHNTTANSDVGIRFTDGTSGATSTDGFSIGEDSNQRAYLWNNEDTDMAFATNKIERFIIKNDGKVGVGTNIPQTTLDVNGNLLIRAYGTTGSGTRGLFFRSDHITTGVEYNCSILTFDHGGGGTTDGLSINGYDGVSFCTGTNTRTERMRIASDGSVGIGTTNPQRPLCVYTPNSTGGLKLIGGTNLGGDSWWLGFNHSNTLDSDDRARIGISIGSTGVGNLYFTTGQQGSQVERMRIASDGRVGIGTNNPGSILDIVSATPIINIRTTTGGSGQIYFGNSSHGVGRGANISTLTDGNDVTLWTAGTGSIGLCTNSIERMRIITNGNVGIGTTNPSAYKLTVQGDIAASADVIAYYSDERLKDIKEYVSDVLPVLSKINVFKYNCNDLAASYGFDKSKNEIGLSAQEIKKYYPELVALAPFDTIRDEGSDINISKSGEDYLTLKYERLVPILLQGIKELKEENNLQQKEIDDLKQENNLQQKEIDDLKLRLTRLELLL
jgi:hypothetical protein